VEPKGYARGQFGRFWSISGPHVILGIAGCANNRGTKLSKNLSSGVGSFASAKVYVRLSQKRWVWQER